ncbi:MAG: hypothetical protein DMG53_07390, partial [Acidobacteria bacterium]
MDDVGVGAINRSLDERRRRNAQYVIHSEQAATIDLAGDGGEGGEAVGALGDALANAPVGVADDCTAFLVNR